MKAGIDEYNTSYDNTVEGSEEIIVTHPLHIICYDETRFWITQKGTSTNTNVDRAPNASEVDTCEVLLSRYECNFTAIVGSKAMGGALPLMFIFQVLVPVVDKYQWPRVGDFPAVLDSNA